MFTGIVEEAGRIVELNRTEAGIRMSVEAAVVGADVRVGDSIAVNGCCLTVVTARRRGRGALRLQFDLLEETWRRTSFSALEAGSLVNLERSLRADGRWGGHFVTGHVDGTGQITRWDEVGADWVLEVRPPRELLRYFLKKGSVALDGISLTVADVIAGRIRLWIIPHTRAVTNLRDRRVGDRVNVEADLLGKYVERLISVRDRGAGCRRPASNKAR